VDDDEFDGTVDAHVVNPHDHLLLFSDGLIELEDAAGQALGVDGLVQHSGQVPICVCHGSRRSCSLTGGNPAAG
jgi:serine phosphatase RsbU (regulator of sigma subunit)